MLKRKLSLWLIIVMLVALIPTNTAVFGAQDPTLESNIVQAMRNNYDAYDGGKAVDASFGNFSNYDVYVLVEEGADLSKWERNNTNLRSESLALVDDVLTTSETFTVKRIAQDYLAAKALDEVTKANQLRDKIITEQGNDPLFGSIYTAAAVYAYLYESGDLDEIDAEAAAITLIAHQRTAEDGNEGGFVKGAWGPDFMTTAQALRTLKGLKKSCFWRHISCCRKRNY